MATPAQITANRLNAQKSTGPSSDEGKAASRFNALKHAASAQSRIIPGEEDSALAGLTDAYERQFQPVGPEEQLLLEKIVAADWTQRRMRRLEAEVLNALIDQQDPSEENPLGAAFIQDAAGPNALQKIFRRHEAASRDWYRAIAQLRQLQAGRIAAAPQRPVAHAEPRTGTPRQQVVTAQTRVSKIGFVLALSSPPATAGIVLSSLRIGNPQLRRRRQPPA
jgi:hypothetical protein